jgi:hypothetical protein
MKINKEKLWNILEKYDSKDYNGLCDSLSRLIQGKSNSGDLLDIFTYLEKIEREDRNVIEEQIGNEITSVLFSM